jgi:hypothetical protein
MSAILLGNGDGALGAPVVSVNANGKVHTMYRGTDGQIHYRRWNGSAWDAEEIVPSPAAKNYQPHVASAPNGWANAVFVGEMGQGSESYAVLYTMRRGKKWSAPVRLSAESYAQLPRLAIAADGTMHVVYNRFGQTFQEIYYTRYDGATWSKPQVIGSGFAPDLALDANGEVEVVWNDQAKLFHAHRGADGTWSAPQRIKAGDRPQTPSIVFDATGIGHVVAQGRDGANQTLVHSQRAVDGKFPRAKRVPVGNLLLTMYPRLTVDCVNRLRLVYQGKAIISGSEPWRVFQSIWDGTAWSAPTRLDTPPMNSINQVPDIHANGEVLAAVWWARRGTALEMYADAQTLDCGASVSMTMEPLKRQTKPTTKKPVKRKTSAPARASRT